MTQQAPLVFSNTLAKVRPSVTMEITAQAAALKAAGKDVLSFSAGEPDFDTPEHIRSAVIKAIEDGGVGTYTNVRGLPALRKAAAKELAAVHGITLTEDNVIINCGAKHSLFNALSVTLNPGDEVIIPTPYWVSYPEMVRLAGAKPIIVETSAANNFELTAEALSKAITPKTRFVILNTPSNPTGAVYSRESLSALAEVIIAKDIWAISDDIYRLLVYGKPYCSIIQANPKMQERTIIVDGVSKAYAMTGWRIGYTAGPVSLINAMSKLQGQSTSNASHPAQVAALAALTGPQDCVETMRVSFDERRKAMVALLTAIPGVKCREPQGAFYAFPDVSSFVGKKTPDGTIIESDVGLAKYLLASEAHVAVVPGTGFGAPGFIRMSYASSMQSIEKGVARLSNALLALH